jgi:hypothetical protein
MNPSRKSREIIGGKKNRSGISIFFIGGKKAILKVRGLSKS